MEKVIAAVARFIICDYLWILGIVVLARGVFSILTKGPEDSRLHRGAAWMLVGGVLIHTVVYLCLAQSPNALTLAAQCFVPAFAAQMAGRFTHKKKPGAVLEMIVTAVTYGIVCLLAVLFTAWIIGLYLLAVFLFLILGDILFPSRRRCRRCACGEKDCCKGCCKDCCKGCGKDGESSADS